MSRRIHRYEVPHQAGMPFVLSMHVQHTLLDFQSVSVADETVLEKLVLWAASWVDAAPRDYLFILVATGGEVPDGAIYVATAQTKFQDVHLFQLSSFDAAEAP